MKIILKESIQMKRMVSHRVQIYEICESVNSFATEESGQNGGQLSALTLGTDEDSQSLDPSHTESVGNIGTEKSGEEAKPRYKSLVANAK